MDEFVAALGQANYKSVEVRTGRRFDRLAVNDGVLYFVDISDGKIYGAKSAVQYNPRREYGSLETVAQYDWKNGLALPNTPLAAYLEAREVTLESQYKPRGRPKKNLGGTP
jgi:hypothetical protein